MGFTDDSYSSDFAEKSELKLLYSDYARKLDGLDLCGLGLKPHRIDSHRFHRFPQIFLTCSVLMTCRILALFLVVSKKKRIFAAEVLNIEGIDYEKYE